MAIKKRLSMLCILAGINIGICSNATADTIQDAKQAIENKNYSTAIIHLKNQLKESPKDAQVRFMLGNVYLSTGKLDSSLKELGRAHDLAPEATEISFRYADALQASGKQKKILDLLNAPLSDKNLESQRLSYLGFAHLSLEQLADARQAFEQANVLSESANAYNGLATVSLFEKDFTAAGQLLTKSIAIEPDKPSTLRLKAKLANLNQQYEQALVIYDQLIENNPGNLSFRLERAATLAVLKKDQLAKTDLQVILDKVKNHPQANFIKAQILLREKDYSGAQKAAQKVINAAPAHMPATFILGAANLALKNYNQAEEYLTIYLASSPDNLKAQNLLANVYLAQGKTQQTILILEGIPQQQLENDPLLLVTLGNAHIKAGDTQKGLQFLAHAQTLAPDNQEIRKRLITAQFQSGELDDAIDELEQLSTIQTDSGNSTSQTQSRIQTDYLLIISYIKQKQLTKAAQKIEQLLTQTPDDSKLLNLKALTEQLNGHSEKAVAQYQAIIKKDKENIPAYMGLARIAALESKWQASENYFKQVLRINPGALKAYLGLAAIAEKQNKPEMTEQYFLDAIEQSKKNIPSQLTVAALLSQWYQSKQQPEKILSLAEKLDKQHPNNNTIRSFLARSQLLNKQNERAERTLKSIITFDKKDVQHRLLLAKILSQDSSRINEALVLLDEALVIQPENQSLYTLKSGLLFRQENYEEAISLAKSMQEKFPDATTGLLLEADIYRIQKQYGQALVIYQAVYEQDIENKETDKKVFSVIVDMLLALDQQDKAIILLTEKIDKIPDSSDNLFKLASLHHEKQQLEQAEIYYQRILANNPGHIISLNNLAWIKIDSDVKEAVRLAQYAHEQAPASAAIMDTYGYFLARDSQYSKGLELLKKAALGIPEDKDIQYHLAFTYEKMGQADKAKEILEKIVYSEQAFSEQKKAVLLYQKIQ